MKYLKKTHMVCFGIEELEILWKKNMLSRLAVEALGKKPLEFPRDKDRVEELVSKVVEKSLRKKENSEIFISLNSCLNFYKQDSLVCFPIKDSVNPKREQIDSFESLINITKENNLTDFAYMSDDGFRQFQLKQYKGELTTEALFKFVKKKILHYGSGNTLDNINLLFALQGRNTTISNINYSKLYEKITLLDLKFDGQILIMYNEEDKVNIMNEVYPKLTTCRKKFYHHHLVK